MIMNNDLDPMETPIYAFCFGMSGDINQPGMGSINFNDLLQNLTLTITTTPRRQSLPPTNGAWTCTP